ncbi:MAG TPA: hypothetical protein VF196_04485 [Casimicrobiaceae bacterium]
MARPLSIIADAAALLLAAAVVDPGAGLSLVLLPITAIAVRSLLGGYDAGCGAWGPVTSIFAGTAGVGCVALAAVTAGTGSSTLILLWPAAVVALALAQITTRTTSLTAAPFACFSLRRRA